MLPGIHSKSAFTLLEVMIGLVVFVIAGVATTALMGQINNNATINRALTAGRLLVGVKISKAQLDPWTPANIPAVVPVGCQQPTSGTLANQDKTDPFDFPSTNVPITTYADSPNYILANKVTTIVGTMNQYVSTYEAASGTLLVTFVLNFNYRGKTYTVTQSTIRAPDQL